MSSSSKRGGTLALVLVLGACAADDVPTANTRQGLDVTAPGTGTTLPFDPSSLLWHWTTTGSGPSDPQGCRDCSTSPPTSATPLLSYSASLRDAIATPSSWGHLPSTFARAAAAGDAQLAATGAASGVSAQLDRLAAEINTACALLGGDCKATHDHGDGDPPAPWAVRFPAVQGRHLTQQYVRSGSYDVPESYALPASFAELRMRGAKSYCAMRSAAFAEGGPDAPTELTHNDEGSWWKWTLGQTGAHVRLPQSQRFTDDADAEAFMIPLRLSSTLAPIAGPAFPDLGELTHDLVWLSADRETATQEDWGPIKGKSCSYSPYFGYHCVGVTTYGYRTTSRELEHDDVLAGIPAHDELELEVPIGEWEPFSLSVGGKITVDSGKLSVGTKASGGFVGYGAPASWLAPRDSVFDAGPEWPSSAADGPISDNGGFSVMGGYSLVRSAPVTPPTETRWREDDDRAITVTDEVEEAFSVKPGLGLKLSEYVEIGLEGESSIGIKTRQDVTLREQLSLARRADARPYTLSGDGNFAQTNLVVVPHSQISGTLSPLTLSLKFEVTTTVPIFGTIKLEWSQPFFSFGDIEFSPNTHDGQERERLRVGEFSDVEGVGADGASQSPKVVSWLPGKALFSAFDRPVAACLADDAPTPVPTTPTPPSWSGPIRGRSCLVGPHTIDANRPLPALGDVCAEGDLGAHEREMFASQLANSWWHNFGGPEQIPQETACIEQALELLCRPTSVAVSPMARSHVFDPVADGAAYNAWLMSCPIAFAGGSTTKDEAIAIGNYVGASFMPLVPCDADGTPTR